MPPVLALDRVSKSFGYRRRHTTVRPDLPAGFPVTDDLDDQRGAMR